MDGNSDVWVYPRYTDSDLVRMGRGEGDWMYIGTTGLTRELFKEQRTMIMEGGLRSRLQEVYLDLM